MKYKPNSDLCPEGEHDAVVMSAVDKKSKSGNEMIEMQVAVYVDEVEYCVTDWLVDIASMQYKIRHFCESAGLVYDAGQIAPEDVEGRNVRVNVVVSDDPKFGKQSRVKDYLPRPTDVKVRPAAVGAAIDSDLPF